MELYGRASFVQHVLCESNDLRTCNIKKCLCLSNDFSRSKRNFAEKIRGLLYQIVWIEVTHLDLSCCMCQNNKTDITKPKNI